ncbi:hypothetical protein R3P38DRAFT_2733179, partial [Favolaschia claudopus]
MHNFGLGSSSGGTKTDPPPRYLLDVQQGFFLFLERTEALLYGNPYKISFSTVSTALKVASAISNNKNELRFLAEDIARRLEIANSMSVTDSSQFSDRTITFLRNLKQELGAIILLSNRGVLRRLLKADADSKTVIDAFRRINDLCKDFQLDFTIITNQKLDRANVKAAMQTLYEASSYEASYDWGNNYDRPSCHPKTREGYLWQLEAWSQKKSSDHPGIFWIYGPAGTGKSAIMQSFCEQLQGKGRLGGSFFFKRGHLSRENAMKVFPTIAYHLSRALPELELTISTSVREDPAVFHKSLATQLKKLIVGPCQAVSLAFPLIIVIDGLDECEGQQSQREILRSLGNAHDDFKSSLAVLIASRPEAHVRRAFEEESSLTFAQTLEIQGSKDDIRTYLLKQFQNIRETQPYLRTAPLSWPGENVVEQFVQQSSGHFLYASTVVKFIGDEGGNPEERIRVIRDIESRHLSSAAATRASNLDQIYLRVV